MLSCVALFVFDIMVTVLVVVVDDGGSYRIPHQRFTCISTCAHDAIQSVLACLDLLIIICATSRYAVQPFFTVSCIYLFVVAWSSDISTHLFGGVLARMNLLVSWRMVLCMSLGIDLHDDRSNNRSRV